MSPSFSFRCTSCNARIKAPVQIVGQWRDCPSCGNRLIVRFQPPPSAGPVLVWDDRQLPR